MNRFMSVLFAALIAFSLFPSKVSAGEYTNVLIKDIRFDNVKSNFLIKFASGTIDPLPPCATNEYPVALYYPASVTQTQRLMYEMLMHAFTYNRKVDVFFSASSCSNNSDSAAILRVAVHG